MRSSSSTEYFARIDADAALGAAERHVDDGALVGHERGQRHHFFFVDLGRVADAALDRRLVMAVLDPPGANDLDVAVVAPQRESRSDRRCCSRESGPAGPAG